MKKLSKIALKNQGSVLNEDEMQKILGGGSYTVCCDWSNCSLVEAENCPDAIDIYCGTGAWEASQLGWGNALCMS